MTVALSHVQFESIHPFRDGNGRVGRLLMMLLLKKYDLLTHPVLFISEYLERNRSAYIGLLYRVSSEDCFDEWMIFLAKGIEEQSIKAQNMILSLRRYKEHLSTLLSGDRLSASFLLFKEPYINAKDVSISLGISIPTATKIVEDLENAGIVREITGKRRNRVFVADDIMEILRGRSTYSAELNR